jgi:ProP effector
MSEHSLPSSDSSATPATPALAVRARELLAQLRERYPVFKECQPLAIGIDKELIAAMPDIDRKALRVALSMHTKSSRYLTMVRKAKTRMNLEGRPAGPISEAQRSHAKQMLDARYPEQAAERETRRREKEEEQNQRRMNEKLNQLMMKFGDRKA